jgi:hypothetical protein
MNLPPSSSLKNIVVHWTAGGQKADDFEKEFYHFLIEGDGKVVEGKYPPTSNEPDRIRAGLPYAAHVFAFNSGSVGVALCAYPERYDITDRQLTSLVEVCVELCKAYNIPPVRQHLLSHMEVSELYVDQGGKWDISYCPILGITGKNYKAARDFGDWLRKKVASRLSPLPSVTLVLKGKEYSGFLMDGSSYFPLRKISEDLGWKLRLWHDGRMVIMKGSLAEGNYKEPESMVNVFILDGIGYVSARSLAEVGGWSIRWDPEKRKVVVG